jgi:hypothetical protein
LDRNLSRHGRRVEHGAEHQLLSFGIERYRVDLGGRPTDVGLEMRGDEVVVQRHQRAVLKDDHVGGGDADGELHPRWSTLRGRKREVGIGGMIDAGPERLGLDVVLAAMQPVADAADQFVDSNDAVVVAIAILATLHVGAIQRDVDHRHQLGDLHRLVVVAIPGAVCHAAAGGYRAQKESCGHCRCENVRPTRVHGISVEEPIPTKQNLFSASSNAIVSIVLVDC